MESLDWAAKAAAKMTSSFRRKNKERTVGSQLRRPSDSREAASTFEVGAESRQLRPKKGARNEMITTMCFNEVCHFPRCPESQVRRRSPRRTQPASKPVSIANARAITAMKYCPESSNSSRMSNREQINHIIAN
jgi:hypothetical protein